MNEPIQRWDTATKRIVALVILILLALLIYHFRIVIPPLAIAFLLAFVLNPIAGFLVDHLNLSRGAATSLIFLALILALLGIAVAPVTVVPTIQRAVISTQSDFIRIITDIGAAFERPVEIRGYQLDLSEVYQELSATLLSFVQSVAQGTLNLVFTIASGALWLLFWLIFILTAAFYLVKDTDRFVEQVDRLAPPGYRDDAVRLRQQITDVWNAFLRSQLLLSLLMAVITTVVCMAVGLPYAGGLGLLAGSMEFVPSIGPFIAAIPAVLLALFQGSSFLQIGSFWFALLVAGLYIVIQQIENNLLVPRILGHSLKLHPLVVLVAILAGGSVGGILGILLAAPVLATSRIVGRYVFCRLYDRDPFAEPAEDEKDAEPQPSLLKRTGEAVLDRLQEKVEQAREQYSEHSNSTGAGDE